MNIGNYTRQLTEVFLGKFCYKAQINNKYDTSNRFERNYREN